MNPYYVFACDRCEIVSKILKIKSSIMTTEYNRIYKCRCPNCSKLMKFTDEVALKNNLKYIKTDTYSINQNMNSLFVKCGYNLVGEIRFLGKEKTFYCYEKVIN